MKDFLSREPSGAKGQVLVGVILLMLVLLIFVPLMVENVQKESRWSVKENKSTSAFHQAEAGIDRAVWKLNEKSSNWDDASTGVTFSGYNNDKTYTDVPGGAYRVQISSGSEAKQVKIVATGRDAAAKEYRAIEALYEAASAKAAIQAPSLQFNSSFKVFWGPIFSMTDISLNSSADELFPRKFAKTSITSSSSYGDRDANPATPNTDCLEYWAYNDATCGSSGVPDMPPIDIDWYRAQSKIAPNLYYDTPPATQTFGSLQDNVEKIRFFEGNATFTGTTHFRGTIVAMGKVTFNASGYDNASYGSYTVSASSIPAEAWKEVQKNTPMVGSSSGGGCAGPCNGGGAGKVDDGNYTDDVEAKADSVCCDQYPADAGYHAVEDFNFKTGCAAHTSLGGHSGEPVSFRGLIYSGGQMDMNSSTVIHGVIVAPGGFKGTSSGILFYDPTTSIQMTSSYTRKYWRATTATPW
jgi:Tfp pilus assembly protein PilX